MMKKFSRVKNNVYLAKQVSNVRPLHLCIEDVQSDYNIQKADVNIFGETRLCVSGKDETYILSGFTLHRNEF